MLIFSVKVAKPVPLNAPSVDATLVTLDVELEFDLPEGVLPEVVLPEEVLPGDPLAGEDVVLRGERESARCVVDSMNMKCQLTRSYAGRSRAPRQRRPRLQSQALRLRPRASISS